MTKHTRRTVRRWAAIGSAAALGLTGCASSGDIAADGSTVITYWMWDSNQMPGYRQCADDFQERNPGIEIRIEQYGWDDYWTQLTATMVAESAPDVFVDHTSQFGKFASLGQILDLSGYLDESDLDLGQYQEGLVELWAGPDGESQYGLPKDWDTEAIFYNAEMVEAAGYSPEDLWELEWNPEDGGTFEDFLAAMTIDENGVRGDEEGFDPRDVATYGLGYNEAGGGYGQVQWSPFALSNGWDYSDENPWGTSFRYDEEEFLEAVSWWRSLIEKGYMPPLAQATSGVGTQESLGAGAYATVIEGSWNALAFSELGGVDAQVAPTPIGPEGQRASVFNGLSDAVWSGTPHPDEAWLWVEYLASTECQDVMAETGRIFPAITTSSDRALETFDGLGIDARAFSVHVEDGTTALTPVTDQWAQLQTIMTPAMDAVMAFDAEPESLRDANARVNRLFDE
ncbi:sugar ABC transporter substrate-binding protein [Microbacterium betulae]|uniref:Sugar ABC transporter substrate-binding protein n=1 Tax=Microbacterium betulae TaxID=2981139 RepID=A0AA97FLB3_9MICO|nr:sugar ABC transporter substrate-binding protein [Microbacterium sp. AB]WOF23542.1 sugar ABC transporter substrate-binding protein [Microbacterium sp. AB]